MVNVLYYDNNRVQRVPLEGLAQTIQNDQGVIWIDLDDPSAAEEDLVLGEILHVHTLAIEDARARTSEDTPHPKLEDFSNYLFIIIHSMQMEDTVLEKDEEHEFKIETLQLNAFLFSRIIVTHHYKHMPAIETMTALCEKDTKFLGLGPDYLFFHIIDSIFDRSIPLIDKMDKYLDFFEDEIFIRRSKQTIENILRFKKTIVKVRRVSLYHREILNRLSFGEFSLITEDEKAYYRNGFNKMSRMVDLTDSYRDAVTGLLDAYLSVTSESQNQVMKFLTIISTIFLPLSVITGFYGMNLAFLPGANSGYSFILVTVLMLLVAMFMIFYFRKNKWL